MPEEVKVVVKQETQGNALAQTAAQMEAVAARIDALKAKIAELNRLEKAYTEGGNPAGAASIRAERIPVVRELREAEAAGKEMLRDMDREQATAARQRHAEERAATRDRVQGEREITREQKEQEAVARERRRAAGALAAAGIAFGGVMVDDYFQRRGIGLRGEASERDYARRRGLRGERGYTVEQAAGDLHAMEDELFQRQNQRAELLNKRTSGALTGGLAGLAAGATTGALIGSVVPGIGTAIGGGIGALIGGGAGAYHGYLSGNRALLENDQNAARLTKEVEQQKKDRDAYVQNALGPELEGRKAILDYDMKSYRVALDKISAEKEYQRLLPLIGAEKAAEAAQDKVALEQRERAGNWAGIIDARSGARDSLRAAAFATGAGTYDGGESAVGWLKKIHEKQPDTPIHPWPARRPTYPSLT